MTKYVEETAGLPLTIREDRDTLEAMKKPKCPVMRKEWPRILDMRPANMDRYMVDARPHGKREYFKLLEHAKTRADALSAIRENRGTEALSFSTENRVMAVECLEKLKPYGKTLRDATEHYLAWLRAEQSRRETLLVSSCMEQYLAQRESDHIRGELALRSIQEIRFRSKQVIVALGALHIGEVTSETVRTYVESFPSTARTRINVRLRLSKFFNFCRIKGWITSNPCEDVDIRAKRTETHILTVAAARNLLSCAEKSDHREVVAPYAAVCLFAGLRPGEAEQLDWAQVCFETETIEVLAHTSKTRDSRFVKMEPVLVEWLRRYAKPSGKLAGVNLRPRWRAVKEAAGYGSAKGQQQWISDVMRHSYASYWLAVHSNRAELAELMGNSVNVIRAHYRRPILKTQAEEYWKIRPSWTE